MADAMRKSCLLLLTLASLCWADVRLPALLSDHAVLQADRPVHIWGWASPGEQVTAEFRGASASTATSASGRFSLYLPPQSAGGPDKLTVKGRNTITLNDVLVGEVWVASGQSNMVWMIRNSNDAEREIAAADYPKMRFFKVPNVTADKPQDDVKAEWVMMTPENAPDLSAVGYFFARHLHKRSGEPFGVIQSAWGGTPAEAWTTYDTLIGDEALQLYLEQWRQEERQYPQALARYERALAQWEKKSKAAGKDLPRKPRPPGRGSPGHHHTPAALYNAMIAPLTPYAIRGAIWYQGENNGGRGLGLEYRRLFAAMIEDWRREWALGDFPFLYVQLANYARVNEAGNWPELRESQAAALGLANTGMAVTIDIGQSNDIHPRNKQDVGGRLALAARAIAYGERDLVYSGPLYRQMTTEGVEARLWFDHVGGGLEASRKELNGGELEGFVIAGPDGRFVPARARIDDETVLVASPEVTDPAAVRYGWENDPPASLFNKEGLPASPFRTDSW